MTSASDNAGAMEYPGEAQPDDAASGAAVAVEQPAPQEHGGRIGPDPTRYGDWEKGGRCIDF